MSPFFLCKVFFQTIYRLSVRIYRLSVKTYRLCFKIYRLSVKTYRLSVKTYRLSVKIYRLSVKTYRLSVKIYRLSVKIHRLFCNPLRKLTYKMKRTRPENESAHRVSRLVKFGNRLVNSTPWWVESMSSPSGSIQFLID